MDAKAENGPKESNGLAYYRCKNHPERIGVVDLGIDAENRYPCHECFQIIKQNRLKK